MGGNPALDYNSQTAAPDPVVKVAFSTDPSQPLPVSVRLQLTWDGEEQEASTFSLAGYQPGDTIALAVRLLSPIEVTENYAWTLTILAEYSSGVIAQGVFSGQTPVVVNHGPYGAGWGIDGISQLISVSGGMVLLYGNGDYGFFAQNDTTSIDGVYTSPAEDFGTLT